MAFGVRSHVDVLGLLKSYGLSTVTGDRYGGEWPRERFAEYGITYLVCKKVRSDLYLELLPQLNSGRVELLDHPRLIKQLCELERRTSRAGKDSIDHERGSHDDVANAVAGALSIAKVPVGRPRAWTIESGQIGYVVTDRGGLMGR